MKKNNIKKRVSNEKGITLVALLITVMVMLIIISVAVSVGNDSIDSTRLQAFYTQLEIIQKRVDDIVTTNEGYYSVNDEGTRIYVDIKTQGGNAITTSQIAFLDEILNKEGIDIEPSEFRYFTIEELEEQLDLSEMEHNVFIHFETRTIVSEDGVLANGETYYVLKNSMYYEEQDTTKNKGTLELTYNISKYGANNYKITVIPNTVGDLIANGTLRYKKTTTKYWETANGLEIIVSELTKYNIEYTDKNDNSVATIIDLTIYEEDQIEHNYVSRILVQATCTQEGRREFTCSDCGNTYVEAIAPVGHNYKSQITKIPTATEEGVRTYTCTVCGDSFTEIIPAVGE